MVGRWNWDEPVVRVPGKEVPTWVDRLGTDPAKVHTDPIAKSRHMRFPVMEDVPSPRKIAEFLRVVRSMNNDQEPDPEGPLADVWRWLKGLCR